MLDDLRQPGTPTLRGIVHCAGGGEFAPVELLDLASLRRELEVRLVAPIALAHGLLPALRRSHGRILLIATPPLTPLAFNLPIHACDFFLNCLARTLAQELEPQGVACVLIRCGAIRTPSQDRIDAVLAENLDRWPPQIVDLYRATLEGMRRNMAAFNAKRSPVDEVANVVEQTLVDPQPPARVQVGYLSRTAALLELLPQGLMDKLLAARVRSMNKGAHVGASKDTAASAPRIGRREFVQ